MHWSYCSVVLSYRNIPQYTLFFKRHVYFCYEWCIVGPNMHPGIPSAGIEYRGHWPWPSRSFWLCWLRILGNLACLCNNSSQNSRKFDCPRNNSSQIWAGITKFAPNMHHGILLVGIENIGPWSSRSFWLWILRNFACPCNNLQWIWSRITQFAPNMHLVLRFSWLVLNMGVIDLDLQGHLAISSQDSKKQHSMSLLYTDLTVGDRTVALNIIARCSITQTTTGQSKVWWLHARKMVVIYIKRI